MRLSALFVFFFMLSGFRNPLLSYEPELFLFEVSVATGSDDFNTCTDKIYQNFELGKYDLSADVFEKALRGYFYLKYHGELQRERFLTIIDFSKSSKEKRLWVIDLYSRRVLFHDLVAHGKYSGDEFARSFSNRFESNQSSLGFYVTGSRYQGKHKLSMKLFGLEQGFNHNAFARGIVFHGADYVSEHIVNQGQTIGRSFGCPAVSQDMIGTLIDVIDRGTCVFLYSPDEQYLKKSSVLNAQLFVPLQEMNTLANGNTP